MKYIRKILILLSLLSFTFFTIGSTEKMKDEEKLKTDGPLVTRSDAVMTADKYARLHYYMSDENCRSEKCGSNFTSGYKIGPRIGVGYKWDGWTDVEEFKKKIGEGYGTGTGGNVEYKEYAKECVIGVSCTGLVSRAWKLNEKYTLDYPNNPEIPRQFDDITLPIEEFSFKKPNSGLLKMGDAFMNATHIMLFVYETKDKRPIIIDSTFFGVKLRKENWDWLDKSGYKAIRYNGIKDDTKVIGNIENPIVINSKDFPLKRFGNTLNVISMVIDGYKMVPERNEQGPENVYLLKLDKAVNLRIELNDLREESIDNSLFLLSSLDKNNSGIAQNCLAYGDSFIEYSFSSGEYYLIVDSNKDLPGEYTLVISVSD